MCDSFTEFPLLSDPKQYDPDTIFSNLKEDQEAKEYWLKCFDTLIKKFSVQAALSQRDDPTADDRAASFYQDYISRIDKLKTDEEK